MNQNGNLYGTDALWRSERAGDRVSTDFDQHIDHAGFLRGQQRRLSAGVGLRQQQFIVWAATILSPGGTNDLGEIFSVTTSGALTVVASFDINNGSNPRGSLLFAAGGFVCGTTLQGGVYGKGVIFQVSTNLGFAGGGGGSGSRGGRGGFGSGGGGVATNSTTISNLFSFDGTNGAGTPQAWIVPGTRWRIFTAPPPAAA